MSTSGQTDVSMSAQPSFIEISPTVEFVSEEETSRRIIERRLSFLAWFGKLSRPGGLTGWRLVGAEPDPEQSPEASINNGGLLVVVNEACRKGTMADGKFRLINAANPSKHMVGGT